MNLLEMVKGYMGDETINRIASTLGIDAGTAKSAIGAAAPTLLAGVAQTANSGEDGARRVANAVDNADESVLGNYGQMLSGGDAQSVAQSGTSMLSNLFGRNTSGGIIEAISRYTGLGGGVAGKLIGLVTPLIFGALKRQKTSMGLDAGGLANLLSSQKSSFMSAIPSGLSNMLGSVPGMSALTGAAGSAAATTREYASSAAGTVRDTGYRAEETYHQAKEAYHEPKSSFGWAIPAALCALLALGLWWWLGSRGEERTATVPPRPAPTVTTPEVTPAPTAEERATEAAAKIGSASEKWTALSTQISDTFASAPTTFSQIHNAASAEAALPKIETINKQLDAMTQSAKALPADSRSKLTSTIREWRDKLQPMTDKALATPGAGEKIRPAVDEMYKKMDALTME